MRLWTYAELKEKVENDLDLREENFITPDEMLGYANAGIDTLEANVHTIYAKYFRTKDTLTLVAAQQEYDLPADIYGTKLLAVIFNDGSTKYKIVKFRDDLDYEELEWVDAADDYRYLLLNDATDGAQQVFYPAPRTEDAGAYVTRWYLRNARRLVEDADTLDIPEGANYVLQYMREQCIAKENGGVAPTEVSAKTERELALFIDALTEMVPDGDNKIQMDISIYDEMN